MRMKVPKMSWRDFLELSKGLRADPRFALSNQDVENGFVKFRNTEALDRLTELLTYHNYGVMPISTIMKKALAANKLRELGFDFNTWRETLEEVRLKGHKDGVDWYVARCPTCADRGNPDTKGHGLNFSDEGIVHCHRGCTYYQIIGYVPTNELEDLTKEVKE